MQVAGQLPRDGKSQRVFSVRGCGPYCHSEEEEEPPAREGGPGGWAAASPADAAIWPPRGLGRLILESRA